MAGLLSDIGLCAIPYNLINGKEAVEWSEAERMTYDRHPEVSGAMLELVPSLRHLSSIVRLHHAPYEGVTPADPTVPVGGMLPVESRILKVVTEYLQQERMVGDMLARQAIRESTASKTSMVHREEKDIETDGIGIGTYSSGGASRESGGGSASSAAPGSAAGSLCTR